MGHWKHEDIFGEFDTGSNNSNSSDSDDEIVLPTYDYMADITLTRFAPTSLTWEPSPIGIPTICYCRKPALLKTQTIGLLMGTKFYSCAGDIRDGDCHIYKLLDDVILEEITLTKTKLGEIEGRLVELLTTVEKEKRMLQEMVNLYKEHNDKLIEMVTKVVRSDQEINDLKEMAFNLQAKVTNLETDLKS
ncbi:unnamed protein product [Arabis nemorensis]|uniref:Zinc finger GRF-type domain-containing protein n=1 Tax=Arabis nemorensis TaxID=586526 RepID=A0A565AR24_9BRAS|nr:unnamed protein product [Arabis nemorensis]